MSFLSGFIERRMPKVSCKRCGQDDLYWWKDRKFWNLVDEHGVLHRCTVKHKWFMDSQRVCRCKVCKELWTKENRDSYDCKGRK